MSAAVIEVLTRARELIENPARWTRGAYALDIDGRPCTPYDTAACRWCLVGALYRASDEHPLTPLESARAAIYRALPAKMTLVEFNDNRFETKHADVLAVLDRAIATEPAL